MATTKDAAAADLATLLAAVTAMRAAQKLELAALPSNLAIWKSSRQKREIARLEQNVDDLVAELSRRGS